ncbi:threonine-phosphate decarboxylase [Sulfitobacter aestuariivivens]|uniref:Aminotransferase n=1 Tax=Sulfitobacter aestuariivivens TaxID=2766981 RepID=A0A927D3T0_9RHOB|nr:threonine-phosphate decarboxylase [Sulfitobacter aestuariivivens]MBD3664635.1 pyridoxal phosphate-dependent class II aminotransferase [Sulfitobacter aestuariivivens]
MHKGIKTRDHGGGLDTAVAEFGGVRADWLDLSTGINPVPYPLPDLPASSWTALPDRAAMNRLLSAARLFWNVPDSAQIVAAPGASAIIARLPYLTDRTARAYIPGPTYNEHAAAVQATGTMQLTDDPDNALMHTYVHPNNPDGRLWAARHMGGRPLTVIDESFCDVCPENSLVHLTQDKRIVVLKSFGKFWGLAGLRLGFAIAHPQTLSPEIQNTPTPSLHDHLGPWAVSGPALEVGAQALENHAWAEETRDRLTADAARLDRIVTGHGAELVGGTTLFRLYKVPDAKAWQDRLARHHIWTRIFPYSRTWLRLGLPDHTGWDRLEAALA